MKRYLFIFMCCLLPGIAKGQAAVTMPDFSFLDTENNRYEKKDVPVNTALLLIYFRSDCPSCRHMARSLKQTAADYPAMLWLVSPDDRPTLSTFEYMMGLLELRNVRLLQDYQHKMHQWYSFETLPFVALYDQSGRLVAVFDQLPDPKTVQKLLSPNQIK